MIPFMKSTHTTTKKSLLRLHKRLERHFLSCSALVGAAGALTSAPAAKAAIIVYDPADIQIPLDDEPGIYFNLETGEFSGNEADLDSWDINIFNHPVYELSTFATAEGDGMQVGVVAYEDPDYPGYRFARQLSKNTPINGSSDFAIGGFTTMSADAIYGQWTDDTFGYLGVTFQLENGDQVFGWIGVDVIDSTNARVTAFAYESTGGQILAGAVPEPGTMAIGFLAVGACGLTFWRRRKAAQATSIA